MRTWTFTKTMTIGLTVALLGATSVVTADETDTTDENRKHPAITVPAEIDFGAYREAEAAPGRVWLINRSDEPLHLKKVTGDCGCIKLLDFEPGELAPHAALPVNFTYAAPKKDGVNKIKTLTFMFADHDALNVKMTIAADAHAEGGKHLVVSPTSIEGVITAPERIGFGEVPPESVVDAEAWLINTGSAPMEIVSAKGDCGCITMRDFSPMTLQPNEARRVSFAVKTPEKVGKKKNTKITFQVAGGHPLSLPIEMRSAEARVASSK